MSRERGSNNRRFGIMLGALVLGMVGLSFAAVPLYRIFCQVTGFGGTPQVVEAGAVDVLDRTITVRFNADTNRDLPWRFRPAQQSVQLKLGEQALVFYQAENRGRRPVVGTATFNVTPLKAGQYFNKIECFCFTEQLLASGQSIDMPVTFYVDPRLNDDPNMADVTTITLSYTFYRAEADAALAQQSSADPQTTSPVHN